MAKENLQNDKLVGNISIKLNTLAYEHRLARANRIRWIWWSKKSAKKQRTHFLIS